MTTKVLITGGAGYLGSVLLRFLSREEQYDITVVDNFTWGYNCPLVFNSYPKIHFLNKNLNALFDFTPYDLIINLVAIPGEALCLENPAKAWVVNHSLPVAIMEQLKPHQYMIHISSTAVYGDRKGKLVDRNTKIDFKGLGIYAGSKAKADLALRWHPRVTILRLGTLFGPSLIMRPNILIHDMMREARRSKYITLYGNIKAKRPIIHVEDVAQRIRIVMNERHEYSRRIFNFATGNFTKQDIAHKIAEICNVPVIRSYEQDLAIQDHFVNPCPTSRNITNDLITLKNLYEVVA